MARKSAVVLLVLTVFALSCVAGPNGNSAKIQSKTEHPNWPPADISSLVRDYHSDILDSYACSLNYYSSKEYEEDIALVAASKTVYMVLYEEVVSAETNDIPDVLISNWYKAQFPEWPDESGDTFVSVKYIQHAAACGDFHAAMASQAFSFTEEGAKLDTEWQELLKHDKQLRETGRAK